MLPNVFNLLEKILKMFSVKPCFGFVFCYTFSHVFKTFEMETKRFENKIGKLRHCLHFIKSKTFSFWKFQSLAKIKNFRNKKYIKLLNGGVLIRAGGGVGVGAGRIFFQKKLREEGTSIRDLRVLTAIVMTPVWCYCMTLCHQEGKKKRILALLVGAN